MAQTGPCEWPIKYTGCRGTPGLDGLTQENRALVERMAVELLWSWTAAKFGLCEVTARPCRRPCVTGSTFWGTLPVLREGGCLDTDCGCRGRCGCSNPEAVIALAGPVAEVIRVEINGGEVSRETYRQVKNLLVRQDGEEWPRAQDLNAPIGAPGTWSVTYLRGRAVPDGGQVAAGVLAEELALALCNSGKCRLPSRVQSISRQGETLTLLDAFEDLEKGRTGIWLVDSWIASQQRVNPGASVLSPDFRRTR